jgi:DNA-binding LytR/AlgR family response regulator
MIQKIKIGIVEDEMIISETIAMALEQLGYEISGVVGTYKEAIEMIENTSPDLVVMDINLGTKKDGIDLASEVKGRFGTPVIFLTANSDAATVNRAKDIHPLAFLVKPFSQNDLFSAIEIGWNNYNKNLNVVLDKPKYIILKVGRIFEKINIESILYLKNDQNYMDIFLQPGKKVSVRYTTADILKLLPENQFVKINRAYIVNVKQVSKIDTKYLHIAQLTIPISKEVRKMLIQKM